MCEWERGIEHFWSEPFAVEIRSTPNLLGKSVVFHTNPLEKYQKKIILYTGLLIVIFSRFMLTFKASDLSPFLLLSSFGNQLSFTTALV